VSGFFPSLNQGFGIENQVTQKPGETARLSLCFVKNATTERIRLGSGPPPFRKKRGQDALATAGVDAGATVPNYS
jgi:hypothetical protein